ncbi:MAG: Prolipoprotein diacylglyceryl transferase, partial [uncultured Solirubrobacteraceae bacterium]
GTGNRALRADDLHVRPDVRPGVHRRRLDRDQAAGRARPPGRLVLRDGLRGARRRSGRSQALVAGGGVLDHLRRPGRCAVLGCRARLVRRPDRRSRRRPAVGTMARRPGPDGRRSRRSRPRARLRDRARRLPARRRRRLRGAVRRAVGDGLSRRHRADDRRGASHAGLRGARDDRRRRGPLAAARRAAGRRSLRPVPGARRHRALPGRVRAPQRERAARAVARPVRLAGDDRARAGLAGTAPGPPGEVRHGRGAPGHGRRPRRTQPAL